MKHTSVIGYSTYFCLILYDLKLIFKTAKFDENTFHMHFVGKTFPTSLKILTVLF